MRANKASKYGRETHVQMCTNAHTCTLPQALALKQEAPGVLEYDDTLGDGEAQAALEKRMAKHGPAFQTVRDG